MFPKIAVFNKYINFGFSFSRAESYLKISEFTVQESAAHPIMKDNTLFSLVIVHICINFQTCGMIHSTIWNFSCLITYYGVFQISNMQNRFLPLLAKYKIFHFETLHKYAL